MRDTVNRFLSSEYTPNDPEVTGADAGFEGTRSEPAVDYPTERPEKQAEFHGPYERTDPEPTPVVIVEDATTTDFVDFRAEQKLVQSVPLQIVGARRNRVRCVIKNLDDANSVYLGGSNVTTWTGYRLEANGTQNAEFIASGNGEIWAICDADLTATVSIWHELRVGTE